MKERGPAQAWNRIEHERVTSLQGGSSRRVEESCINLLGAGLLEDRGALDSRGHGRVVG